MWVYNSADGTLRHDGELLTMTGWSGHDLGRNNPAMEEDHDIGPIPRGKWAIGGAEDGTHLGPIAMPLTALGDTNTFGRSGFFIHGASSIHPSESSHGCVILPHDIREQIDASDDRILMVV